MLRLATYRALGGATTIVRTHLDKVMATERLRPHRDSAAALFHFLVTPTGMLERYTEAIAALNEIARIYISQGNQNAADPFPRYARELELRRDRKQSEP